MCRLRASRLEFCLVESMCVLNLKFYLPYMEILGTRVRQRLAARPYPGIARRLWREQRPKRSSLELDPV